MWVFAIKHAALLIWNIVNDIINAGRVFRFVALVQPELEEKDWVKQYRGDRQDELYQVESSITKEWVSKGNCVQSWLQEGQRSAGEVKSDILPRPAITALTLPIQVDLWQILDEGDGSLCVAHHEESVHTVGQWMAKDFNAPINENGKVAADKEDDPENINRSLLSALQKHSVS